MTSNNQFMVLDRYVLKTQLVRHTAPTPDSNYLKNSNVSEEYKKSKKREIVNQLKYLIDAVENNDTLSVVTGIDNLPMLLSSVYAQAQNQYYYKMHKELEGDEWYDPASNMDMPPSYPGVLKVS